MTRRFRPASRPRHPARRLEFAAAPHEVLGLPACEEDAVRVIEVSQLLLRRWRRVSTGASVPGPVPASAVEVSNRIRQILEARQAMLEGIHADWRGSADAAP